MSDDEKRAALLQEIAAWREAWADSKPGSPEYQMNQREMKEAEWKLQALGPPDSPGVVIKIVSSDPAKE